MSVPHKQGDAVPVYLTPDEAVLFVMFQKRYAFMKLLESIKAFDMRSGHITLHFDNIGQIASIDKHEHYKLP